MGPLISPEAKARVEFLIQSGVDEGAKLLLDGRRVSVKGYENGNFVGPTILSNVTVGFCSAVFNYLSPKSRDFTFTHMQSAPHQQDCQPRLKEKLNILCYLLNLCAPPPFQLSVRVFYCVMPFIYSHAF